MICGFAPNAETAAAPPPQRPCEPSSDLQTQLDKLQQGSTRQSTICTCHKCTFGCDFMIEGR